jgi:Transglycosylase SLT domain
MATSLDTMRRYSPGKRLEVPDRLRQVINEIAQQEGVDPALLTAVVRQETGGGKTPFDPRTAGGAGDYGLAQVTLPVAKHYLRNPNLTPEQLYDEVTNLTAAARFLKDLGTKYADNKQVLTAYNSGETRMNRAVRAANAAGTSWESELAKINRDNVKYGNEAIALYQGAPPPAAPPTRERAPGFPVGITTPPQRLRRDVGPVPEMTATGPQPVPQSATALLEQPTPAPGPAQVPLPGAPPALPRTAQVVPATPEEIALGLDSPNLGLAPQPGAPMPFQPRTAGAVPSPPTPPQFEAPTARFTRGLLDAPADITMSLATEPPPLAPEDYPIPGPAPVRQPTLPTPFANPMTRPAPGPVAQPTLPVPRATGGFPNPMTRPVPAPPPGPPSDYPIPAPVPPGLASASLARFGRNYPDLMPSEQEIIGREGFPTPLSLPALAPPSTRPFPNPMTRPGTLPPVPPRGLLDVPQDYPTPGPMPPPEAPGLPLPSSNNLEDLTDEELLDLYQYLSQQGAFAGAPLPATVGLPAMRPRSFQEESLYWGREGGV